MIRLLRAAVAVLLAVAVMSARAVRAEADHDGHDVTGGTLPHDGRVGVLLADHGEPPLYNEWTYESFREFFAHLIAMGIIPSWLTALETGTILYDADCPGCDSPRDAPRLIDAWLGPHDGPAAFVPASDSLAAHYVIPSGPGLREPDIYEHVGLAAWHEWQRMGGRSPNYDEKLAKKTAVVDRLREAYGDRLAVRVGYGIDPRINGGRQGIREALDALVNKDRVESLVVVYHGVGFSDIMQTHHLRHQISAHLEALGKGEMAVRYADPLGTTDHYVAAIVDKVQAELALLPDDASVAIHLSGHGLATTSCGDYDCGADAYHRYARELFERVRPAVERAVDRPGRLGVFHIYGDSGEGDRDPDNEVSSPLEALDARAAEGGWTHVVDVPYEFDSNSRDTLIVLRQGYRRAPPDWNSQWESHFPYRGLQVKIANANGGEGHKTDALHAVTLAALRLPVGDAAVPREPGAAHAHVPGRGDPAADSQHPGRDTSAPEHEAETTQIEAVSVHADGVAHRLGGTAAGSRQPVDAHPGPANEHAEVAAPDASHVHEGGGSGAGVGLLLSLAGGAALAVGITARRRHIAGRVAAAGLGAQLAGLGWDVVTHAQAGERVHLLENGGHWVALGGLLVTAAAAAHLLRAPLGSEHADGPGDGVDLDLRPVRDAVHAAPRVEHRG